MFHIKVVHFVGILKKKCLHEISIFFRTQKKFPRLTKSGCPNQMCPKLVYSCLSRHKTLPDALLLIPSDGPTLTEKRKFESTLQPMKLVDKVCEFPKFPLLSTYCLCFQGKANLLKKVYRFLRKSPFFTNIQRKILFIIKFQSGL